MEIPNKRKLQEIALNHSCDIKFKDFMKLYEDYIKGQFSLLVNDTTLPLDNSLPFKKNLLKNYS